MSQLTEADRLILRSIPDPALKAFFLAAFVHRDLFSDADRERLLRWVDTEYYWELALRVAGNDFMFAW